MSEHTAEFDYTHAPIADGVAHREAPTFRWEFPKSACGMVLHPYLTLAPRTSVKPPICPTCYPPPPEPACEACGVELSDDGACWWCDDGPTPAAAHPITEYGTSGKSVVLPPASTPEEA